MIVLTWLGSGFAFAIGILLGMWILPYIGRRPNPETQRSLELMEERNSIDRQLLKAVETIASRIEG